MKVSFIVPAYNEGKGIYSNLKQLKEFMSISFPSYELIVVSDGSKDNTYVEAKKLEDSNLKVVGYSKNMGKGFALRYGLKFVSGDYVGFIDGDGDLDFKQILILIKYLKENGADIVIGSKWHKLSKINYPLLRKIMSRSYWLMLFLLFRLEVKDTQTGLKLMTAECARKLLPLVEVNGFGFDIELLVNAKRFNYKVVEAPVVLNYQFTSNVGIITPIKVFKETIGVVYRYYFVNKEVNEIESVNKKESEPVLVKN